MGLLVDCRLGDQFIYVPQTILSGFLILIPQIFCIIDPFQQRFDQIRQCIRRQSAAKYLDQIHKSTDLGLRSSQSLDLICFTQCIK